MSVETQASTANTSPCSDLELSKFVELVIQQADDDGWAAHVPKLPGVVSEGDEPVEAFRNIEEALRLALEVYADAGDDVPWLPEPRDVEGQHRSKWIRVDA